MIQTIEYQSDFEIIDKILEGDVALLESLIRKYNPILYKAGRGYNYSHEDTQDLMQDSFIDAYMNLSKFEKRSSFKTWLVRIMINNCYKRKRKLIYKNEISGEINENAIPSFTSRQIDLNNMIIHKELNEIITQALTELPEDYRLVFTLREISGLNVRETSEILQISESNVKVRLNRAKSLLRKKVEKNYSPEDIFEFNLVYCDAMVDRVMRRVSELKLS